MSRKPRLRWSAIGALLTTLVGVATDAHVVAAVGAAWPALAASPYLVVAGAVWAAITKPVARTKEEREPKP